MKLSAHRIPPIAASAALWAWCAVLNYAMITEVVDYSQTEYSFTASSSALITQAIGLVLYVTTMFLAYPGRFASTIGGLSLTQVAIFLIIYLSFGLQFHGDELAVLSGIFYTSLLMVTALSISILWTLDPSDFERCMTIASVVLCSFGVLAIAIHGWPDGRNVGSIQPNGFATPLIAGFVLSQFGSGWTGIVVRVLCISMVALVDSRFAIFGCVTAIVAYGLTYRPWAPAKVPALIITLIVGMVFWPHIVGLLALDDSARGLSSGFSGRDDRWNLALESITSHPLGIGFKRAIGDEAGHNGFLKTVLEFGIPGGALIIFCIAGNLAMAGLDAISFSGKTQSQHRFECARFGGLAGLLFGAFFQPQIFSLGDAFAIAFLLLLFKPRTKSIPAGKPLMRTAQAPAQLQ